jgi:hypothetical protein
VDVISVTSWSELARDGQAQGSGPDACHLTRLLGGTRGPVVAATDYVRAVPESVRAFVPPAGALPRWAPMASAAATRARRCGSYFAVDAASIRVARTGIRKLVLFNSHGGQLSVMDIVARDLRTAHGLIVYSTNWFTLPLGDEVNGLFPPEEHRFGIHAGDMETSMMLALRPQFVDMAQARHFQSTAQERAAKYPILGNGTSAKLGWQVQDYNPMGAAGNAAVATAAKGQAVIDAAGRQLALLLQEVAALPLSTLTDMPHIPT